MERINGKWNTGKLIRFFVLILSTLNIYQPGLFGQGMDFWLTKADQSILFEQQEKLSPMGKVESDGLQIAINERESYQNIDGFGFTLTGGSARLIHTMSNGAREQLLNELFSAEENSIGISYLRLSIGASDLSDSVFSYNDLPDGGVDLELNKFSIDAERFHLIPVLQDILKINPEIKIMGSPWSAPKWMKTNNSAKGGSLQERYMDVYSVYLVKYIQEMEKAGVPIDAITVQNEPLHPGNNPSMYMSATDQALFIKKHLGPAFIKAKLNTKIIIYDHNADKIDYPISILNDPDAKKYIDGSAFHLYGGEIGALSKVHDAHPDKHLYFTEQWIGAPGNFPNDLKWHVENLIIGATRNWCRNVLEWNLAADKNNQPHTDNGGCNRCLGAITIDGDTILRNPAYYIVAHASKFVRPGSERIKSNSPTNLPNVAFKTPDNKLVLIVLNVMGDQQEFQVKINEVVFYNKLDGGAVGTFVFSRP